MKKISPVAIYFALPALVEFWLLSKGKVSGGTINWSEAVLFGTINYALFALPQFCWFGIARFTQVSSIVSHAGFLGASSVLVGIVVAFECCLNNSSGLGWFYYWPLAAGGISLFVWLASRMNHE